MGACSPCTCTLVSLSASRRGALNGVCSCFFNPGTYLNPFMLYAGKRDSIPSRNGPDKGGNTMETLMDLEYGSYVLTDSRLADEKQTKTYILRGGSGGEGFRLQYRLSDRGETTATL